MAKENEQLLIAVGKDLLQLKRTWFSKDGAIIEHRGNSCEAVENSDESRAQLFRRSFYFEERKWTDILPDKHFKGHTIEAKVSNLVMRSVRRYDQDERETDGGVHWNSMGSKLRKAFQKAGRQQFSGLSIFLTEATKRSSSIARS